MRIKIHIDEAPTNKPNTYLRIAFFELTNSNNKKLYDFCQESSAVWDYKDSIIKSMVGSGFWALESYIDDDHYHRIVLKSTKKISEVIKEFSYVE